MSTYPVDVGKLPHVRNVEVSDGDDHRDYFTVQVNGTATDLTSATWALRIADRQGGTVSVSKTTTSAWTTTGVKVDDASAGQITVVVAAADVTTLAPGRHYYEVVCTFPAAHSSFPSMTKTILAGEFRVKKDAD